jgi:hypothetical protein
MLKYIPVKKSSFSLQNWISTCIRLNLDPHLSPYTKMNSKGVKDLTVKPETLNLIAESIEKTLEDISIVILF